MAAFVRNAHIGLLDKELVHGTITFGYRGEVIPGEMTRRNKPKKKWAIDDDAAAWVRRIFDWYTSRELTFAAIVRRLNTERAPLPPRCQTGRWTELAVKALLGNRRYVGDFAYGRKEAVWQAKEGYSRQYAREKPLAERRIERLRILDDAIFTAAQSRLSEHVGRGGRRPAGVGSGDDAPHLLRGLLWCPRHQRFLGTYAHGWACLGCKKELRQLGMDAMNSAGALYSQVDPTLAVRLLCETIANLFEADEGFVSMVREKFTTVVGQLQTPDPATITRLQREHVSWTTKINAIYDAPAETEADKAEQHQRLAEFQRRRQEVQRQLNEIDDAARRQLVTPTEDEVRDECRKMREVLLAAATGDNPELAADARAIIHDVTGGRVIMTQQGAAKAKQGWLRASFTPHWVGSFAHARLPQGIRQHEQGSEVRIDFREPTAVEMLAGKVIAGVNEGRLLADIAADLNIARSVATAAYQHWYRSRGLVPPDGRARRATLAKKHREAPTYQAVAEEVMKRFDAGMLLGDIANELGLDRNTITSSVAWWHKQRGLPVPDGRTRRIALAVKTGNRPENNCC
jgi:hypothetical protein